MIMKALFHSRLPFLERSVTKQHLSEQNNLLPGDLTFVF